MSLELTQRDRHQLKRLLGLLQTHLESAIESNLTPDGGTMTWSGFVIPKTQAPANAHNVEIDRIDWVAAERWVRRLDGRYMPNERITPPGTANARPPEETSHAGGKEKG